MTELFHDHPWVAYYLVFCGFASVILFICALIQSVYLRKGIAQIEHFQEEVTYSNMETAQSWIIVHNGFLRIPYTPCKLLWYAVGSPLVIAFYLCIGTIFGLIWVRAFINNEHKTLFQGRKYFIITGYVVAG